MRWTEPQQEAITTTGVDLCVDASAGSGKTMVLIERMMALIEHKGVPLERIVAITFTEKAAAEMKERLRARCRRNEMEAEPDRRTFWREVSRQVETARISTIHAFCMRLLKENALRLGGGLRLDPDFVLMTEAEAYLLRDDVAASALADSLERGDAAAERLCTELGVVGAKRTLGSLLAMSGLFAAVCDAWAGMTADELVDAWRNTKRAKLAEYARTGVFARFKARLQRFASLCKKETDKREQYRQRMVAALDCGDCETSDRTKRLETLIGDKDYRGLSAHWESKEVYEELSALQKEVVKLIEQFLAEGDPDTERAAAQLALDILEVGRATLNRYHEAKAARGTLDFDDLIAFARAMLRDNPGIRERIARNMDHLLVDEFQDTDSEQYEIIQSIAGAPGGPELFLVGDAKQSIYRFRGAEVEVFDKARQGRRTVFLDVNFRTVPEILGFVNDFFEATGLLAAVESPYKAMRASRQPSGSPCVEFLLIEESDTKRSAAEAREEEAELLARHIVATCAGGRHATVRDPATGESRPPRFGDIAVLLRAMSNVQTYERALRQHGIPCRVVAGAGFFERQEVLDLRNLLALVVDPCDEAALLGYLRGPIAGISDDTLARLCREHRLTRAFYDMPDDISLPPTARDELHAARVLLEDIRERAPLPLFSFLRHVLDRTGFEAMVAGLFLGERRVSNLRKVVSMAEDFARTRQPHLSAFVRYLEEVAAREIREGDAALPVEGMNAVTVMTVHKAKGLEFPIVYLPDLSRSISAAGRDGILLDRAMGLAVRTTGADGIAADSTLYAAARRDLSLKEEAEEARTLYVAMTRAQDRLILSGSPSGRSDSYITEFDRCYGIKGCSDGEILRHKQWDALVCRSCPDLKHHAPSEPQAPAPAEEDLARRVGPPPLRIPARRSFSVTDLLPLMVGVEPLAPGGKREWTPLVIPPEVKGTLVHELLEQWDFRANGDPPIEEVLRRSRLSIEGREVMRAYLGEFVQRFRECELGRRLAAEQRLERECPFALRLGDALAYGVVDLLLEDGTVIDYKTGKRHPIRDAEYEEQLRLYAEAVRLLRGATPPAAYLYYVDSHEARGVDVSRGAVQETMRKAENAVREYRRREHRRAPSAGATDG